MAAKTYIEIDRPRIKELTEREAARLDERTQGSREFYARAQKSLVGGVASSYQSRDPWPIYLSRGKGAQVWDIDGNEYLDFHNGFGSMVQGHAHPAITRAVNDRIELGTHFAAPTEDAIVVGEELTKRWGLPQWRYVNSGSEATMDAIRIARAATGRDTIVKIFGSYHGHHDYVMVSIGVEYDKIGDRFELESLPYGLGIPKAVSDMTIAVPFNDAEAMERRIERLVEEGRAPACVIMEPAMMNLGVVLPEPGYLEAVREITRKHGVLLIFDEVKTGLCIAAGGAVERFGVMPDLVTLAKALGGGLPSGAIGGTPEVFESFEEGKVVPGRHLRTTATRCRWRCAGHLLEVMTPEAYAHLDTLNEHLLEGCSMVISKYSFPGCWTASARRAASPSPEKIADYTTFKANQDAELCELAWLYNMNRDVYMTPGREEEWTLSIKHTLEDCDRFVGIVKRWPTTLTS